MRGSIRFAAAWHVLWSAFLLPYAVLTALAFGGQDAAQTVVGDFAIAALPLAIALTLALPLGVAIAAMASLVGARLDPVTRMLLATTTFGIAWLFAVQVLLPIADPNGAFAIKPVMIWAAAAGAVYGLVLALVSEGM
jgi:hypothetical protein